jgi:hypothetical protein
MTSFLPFLFQSLPLSSRPILCDTTPRRPLPTNVLPTTRYMHTPIVPSNHYIIPYILTLSRNH